MNDVLIGFSVLAVFTIFCFVMCLCSNKHNKKKYYKIFCVDSCKEIIDSPAGIVTDVRKVHYATVYGMTFKGKKKVLGRTLDYDNPDACMKEAELMMNVLEHQYL